MTVDRTYTFLQRPQRSSDVTVGKKLDSLGHKSDMSCKAQRVARSGRRSSNPLATVGGFPYL